MTIALAERAVPYGRSSPSISEEDLARLWEEQRLPSGALVTTTGVPLQVVYRGRRNRGPGPDFLDAIIATTDGHLLQGDVEVHTRSSDFFRHGHHRDGAYRRLALHLVFWHDGLAPPARDGGPVPVVALSLWVGQRTKEIRRWLEGPAPWQEPCRTAVARLGTSPVARCLEDGGWLRIEEKIAASLESIGRDGPTVSLWRGLAEAVGYGSQRQAFGYLAQSLSWPKVQEVAQQADAPTMEALLLGAAGLLPGQRGSPPPEPYAVLLEERWAGLALRQLVAVGLWDWAPVRPANSPARRLAGLARLLLRFRDKGLADGLLQAVLTAKKSSALLEQLTVVAEGFWRSRYDLCRPSSRLPASLIGTSRAIELASNIVLPWSIAWGLMAGESALVERARRLLQQLPRPSSYGLIRQLEEAIRGMVSVNALRQQGMLHLYRHYCSLGSCGRCPLS